MVSGPAISEMLKPRDPPVSTVSVLISAEAVALSHTAPRWRLFLGFHTCEAAVSGPGRAGECFFLTVP